MRRRDLLKTLMVGLPLASFGRVWAAPQTSARLLVVFLRGGYDAANVVAPVSSDFYHVARPTLALARPDSANPLSALRLDPDWGLHPALKDSLYPLWSQRQLAFVPFAGTDDLTRSHFETQDTIELGQPVGGHRNYGSGYMARLASALTGVHPIAFTQQLPLSFRGGGSIPNVGVSGLGKPAIDARQAALIESMYGHTALAPAVSEGFAVRDEVYETISKEMARASRGAVSPKGFELSARRIGALMRDRFNLGFVDVGGWDTHVNEGGATGYLAGRLGELGRGLAGYADELGPTAWRDTVVVVISEFGRTFRENGDHGTDHGHGSVYWVMGGSVKGGVLAGEQVRVTEAALNQDRDLPVLTDYRSLFGGIFQRVYGLGSDRLAAIFPAAAPTDLKLV